MTARACRVCENRSFEDDVQNADDSLIETVVSPRGVAHIAETSNSITLCGRDSRKWPREDDR
jgi:hypothetical protein